MNRTSLMESMTIVICLLFFFFWFLLLTHIFENVTGLAFVTLVTKLNASENKNVRVSSVFIFDGWVDA